jgi:hypothetical protein
MHVHGAHLNPNAVNLHSALAEEKAAAAKQAAEVRKKLLASAIEMEGEDVVQASSMAGDENEEDSPGHNQKHPPAKNSATKKDSADEDPSADPISLWG